MKTIKKNYGYRPDQMDFRDHVFNAGTTPIATVHLGDKYKLPPVQNQQNLGSCTGNGIASVVYFDLLNKHTQKVANAFQPSRLFIYYNERVIEGTVRYDAGAQIRDGIKAVNRYGVCDEKLWAYNINRFAIRPSTNAFKNALNFKAVTYQRIDNTSKASLIGALQQGFPIVFGFTVYENFESDVVTQTGVVPMPQPTEQVLGGHCVYITGYNLDTDRFTCVNSWGLDWGNAGTFTIPAEYLTNNNLADDFWIITTIL